MDQAELEFYTVKCTKSNTLEDIYEKLNKDDIDIESIAGYASELAYCGESRYCSCKQFVDLSIKFGKLLEKKLESIKEK